MAYTDIDKPSDYFETVLYTGNGGTQSITSLDFAPALCWFKSRTTTDAHAWYDSVRGATKRIKSNSADAETTQSTALTSFNSDGFSIGAGGDVNTSSASMAVWNWKETADAGFDIVSYTGNGSARTLSHSLSAIPKMIIVKRRDASGGWIVYHASLGNTKISELHENAASQTSSASWNNTTPTTSVFTVGDANATNANNGTFIAYLFAEKKGYSKFGKYTSANSHDSTFVYLGFKPSMIMFKNTSYSGGSDWHILDRTRYTFNGSSEAVLEPNTNDAVNYSAFGEVDFLSNGFKIRNDNGVSSGGYDHIYMAFAESPFVTSTGVPATAR